MTQASDTQVGGDHYKAMGDFQPWDVLRHWLTPEEYRGYQKGVAIAYLARERQKGRDEDIAKAAHHLRKLLEVLGEPPQELAWIEWPGGECPVHPDTEVEVRLRLGAPYVGQGKDFNWLHFDGKTPTEIVAYRLVPDLPF